MKHLKIKNFGPLKSADIDLGQVNLIIGLQGSGKSCAMMTACYCTWVEKRIMLRQSEKEYLQGTVFIDGLVSYYHADGYIHPRETYIEYSSDYMSFSYDCASGLFCHKWGKQRWNYQRAKVSYIPAERNVISLVSNWDRMETSYDNILDFKADWDIARRFLKRENNILGTGISYEYDETVGTDSIVTSDGNKVGLSNSSSGFKSLIPQFVLLDYLYRGIYADERKQKEKSYSERLFLYNLFDILYEREQRQENDSKELNPQVVHVEGRDFVFQTETAAKKFKNKIELFLYTRHSEIFLEEPESNLFPPTQAQLVNWIIEMSMDSQHKNFFFIATHSPYIMSCLLQEKLKDFKLFITVAEPDGFVIKEASETDVQEVYDNGADAFFNLEVFK